MYVYMCIHITYNINLGGGAAEQLARAALTLYVYRHIQVVYTHVHIIYLGGGAAEHLARAGSVGVQSRRQRHQVLQQPLHLCIYIDICKYDTLYR